MEEKEENSQTTVELQETSKLEEKKEEEEDAHGTNDGIDWDYVIMFGNIHRPKDNDLELPDDHPKTKKFLEVQKTRKEMINLIKSDAVGLHITRKKATDRQSLFVLITADQARLEAQAEHMELTMRLKDEFGGGWSEFEIDKKHMFTPEGEEGNFFRKLQKIFLIESILQGDPDYGGAGLNLDKLVSDGIITKIYPMHDEPRRKELIREWANPKKFFRKQPLDLVRNYFGEEITLYFAWLGFYTQWLWFASILGCVATIFWIIDKVSDKDSKWAGWWSTVYAVFLSLWATLFLEYWKRYNNTLNYRWGMMGYKEKEVERSQFKGEPIVGVYHGGVWVTLDPEKKYDFTVPKKKYYPAMMRRVKTGFGFPILVTMAVAVIIATFAVLTFRLFVQKKSSLGGAIAGAALNAISIIVMNIVYKIVATKLNDWENYRTESEYENNLIFKIFLFYFVNSYVSLYYIAFFKKGFKFFYASSLEDSCKNGDIGINIVGWGCADELTLQLVTILAVNMFIGQAREVALPWLVGKLQLLLLLKKTGEEKKSVGIWERDSKKQNFPGTFDEYSEMVIQYGYITLFAATFPLAPLMSVLNNMVEIRTDAFKLLTSHPRPEYRGAQNIGTWYQILEVVGIIAVMTNCLLIGLSFPVINVAVRDNAFQTFGIVVIMEHVIIILKWVISVMVPDLPGDIVKKLAHEDFLRNESIKLANRKAKGFEKPTWKNTLVNKEDDGDDDDVAPSNVEIRLDA